MTTVYMFPGQGSQFKGMGTFLFKEFQDETNQADKILGYSIQELCLNDPLGQLNLTEYTQPAIYFLSCLEYLKKIKDSNIPTFVCGHSLGEYAALYAAGVYNLYTGLSLVQQRGKLMAQVLNGGMLAVMGPNVMNIGEILNDNEIEDIDIANYNSYEQIVLSGPKQSLNLCKTILEKIQYRCIELPVSGAFHSRYMEEIRIALMKELTTIEFNIPNINIISSVTANFFSLDYAMETLGYQLTKSVKWVQTINFILAQNPHASFQEIGPGEVLTRLKQKIDAYHVKTH